MLVALIFHCWVSVCTFNGKHWEEKKTPRRPTSNDISNKTREIQLTEQELGRQGTGTKGFFEAATANDHAWNEVTSLCHV